LTAAQPITAPILPRWLPARQAAAYSALGLKRLKGLAQAGRVVGFQDPDSGRGDWIFDRLSLDAYREAQGGQDAVQEAVIDAAQRLGL